MPIRRVLLNLVTWLVSLALVFQGSVAANAIHPRQIGFDPALQSELQNFLATQSGTYSLSLQELTGERRFLSINGNSPVESASTFKLFYAWLALKKIDQGKLRESSVLGGGRSLGLCLKLMISLSDNECAADIRKRLGNRWFNSQLAAAGFSNSRLLLDAKGDYVNKITTADDLTALLRQLADGTLLSKSGTAKFNDYLLKQVWRSRIASSVPPEAVVRSKSGQLLVNNIMTEADAAIVTAPGSTYAVTIIGNQNATIDAIRGASSIIYRHLVGPFEQAKSYPTQQFTTNRATGLRYTAAGKTFRTIAKGTKVEMVYALRDWIFVKVGSRSGYVPYQSLTLRPEYRQ